MQSESDKKPRWEFISERGFLLLSFGDSRVLSGECQTAKLLVAYVICGGVKAQRASRNGIAILGAVRENTE